jgi:hypothetical protein
VIFGAGVGVGVGVGAGVFVGFGVSVETAAIAEAIGEVDRWADESGPASRPDPAVARAMTTRRNTKKAAATALERPTRDLKLAARIMTAFIGRGIIS